MDKTQEEILNEIRERVLKRENELRQKENEAADISATLQALEEITSVPREEMEHIAAEIRRSHESKKSSPLPEEEGNQIRELPATVQEAYQQLPAVLQKEFLEEYRLCRHNVLVGLLLWAVPPPFSCHNLYGKRIFLQFIYTISVGGLFLWWIIDFFRVPAIVEEYNRNQARKVLKKILKQNQKEPGLLERIINYCKSKSSLFR